MVVESIFKILYNLFFHIVHQRKSFAGPGVWFGLFKATTFLMSEWSIKD